MKNMHDFHKYTFTNRGTKVGQFYQKYNIKFIKNFRKFIV